MHPITWWLLIVLYTIATTNLASLAVSIYLHRDLTHKSIELHPISFGFFRFIIWFITGMEPAEWKVVHLTHHRAPSDSIKDPHSPENEGMWKIVLFGVWYYILACRELKAEIAEERKRCGDIWGRVPLRYCGVLANLALNVLLWGPLPGLTVWAIQCYWIPFWAAGVINGLGHGADEKHEHTQDKSHDILSGAPTFLQNILNVITGGESRHHAHHLKASSARFTTKDEFDWGYTVICALVKLRLAKILRV
jgi:stearoyl-CoA desaturase (Delta-9 desaturase)